MSKAVDFKLDLNGLRDLMKSAEMQGILDAAGETVARNAGAEYGHRVTTASYVSMCNVFPTSEEAAKEQRRENVLLQAMGAASLPMKK